MGMWPFRRRNQRRKSAGGAGNPPTEMHNAGTLQGHAKHDEARPAESGRPERRRSRRDTNRKPSRDPKKLQRHPDRERTYSFSPGRKDSIRVPRAADRPPLPPLPANVKGKGRSKTPKSQSLPAIAQPQETTTNDWQRMPTLHKRSAQELAYRKSSKRRKEEHDREAEIKAMVAYMPARLAADGTSSGRPTRRESKRMKGGLNRHVHDPSSDISLPMAESLSSSFSGSSGDERRTSYKLSAMLAPRPTIKYTENPRYVPGASGFNSPRSDSKKRRVSDRVDLPAEVLMANKRIDELADDLSAGELRELMERDQKRREKKRLAEQLKMEKRLARRQEKQKAEEAIATRDGTSPPVNVERGVFGRDVVGLGIGTSAVVTSNKRKSSSDSDNGRGKRPAEIFRRDSDLTNHSASFAMPESENEDPVLHTAIVGTVSKASPTLSGRGHHRGASSISQMIALTKTPEPEPVAVAAPAPPARIDPPRQSSETSTTSRAPQSWTSFFKLRARNKRGSTPSSFSNTSRDSMHSGPPPPAQQIGYHPMRSTSNVPKRTMSKFREDLPELPISPPDSRVQSPDTTSAVPIPVPRKTSQGIQLEDPRVRYDTPTSGYRSIDAMRLRNETPTSGHRSVDVPSPEPTAALSQSLASIDSEGSWLSGRKGNLRRSQIQHPPRSSNSLNKKYKEFSESAEELGIAEDEYFSRLTPGPEDEYKIGKQSSGNPMPSSDDEEGSIASPVPSENVKWSAVARQPTVIDANHHAPRTKSREGFLNDFDDDSISELQGETSKGNKRKSYGRDLADDDSLHRATSIDLGKGHVRRISAGSARLLDLKPRDSTDSKRFSG